MYIPPITVAKTQWKVLEQRNGGGKDGNTKFVQDVSPAAHASLLQALPAMLLRKTASKVMGDGVYNDAFLDLEGGTQGREIIGNRLVQLPGRHYKSAVRQAVAATVRSSSRRQAMLGMLSAGAIKSARYVWRKLQKS